MALTLLVVVGCTTQDFLPVAPDKTSPRLPRELDASRTALEQQPASYTYVRRSASMTGRTSETRVTVVSGAPTAREYMAWMWTSSGGLDVIEQWAETGAELGTHPDAWPVRTLPELYEECRVDVLSQDPATHELTFAVFDNGVLATCLERELGCVDDCARGVSLSRIDFGP